MSSKTRFDLEQEIMSCWNITTDLDVVYQAEHLYDDEDAMQNALLGLMSLYELKFAKLWDTFESCVHASEFDARVDTVVNYNKDFWGDINE